MPLQSTGSQPKLNNYGRFWTGILESTHHHCHQNTNKEWCSIPPVGGIRILLESIPNAS